MVESRTVSGPYSIDTSPTRAYGLEYVSQERRSEDLKRIRARKNFKRDYGKAARDFIAGDSSFTDQLADLTRKAKRAFYRASTDFATVELTGQTAFEQSGLNIAMTPLSRNEMRFRMSGVVDVQSMIQLAKDAGHAIVVGYQGKTF